MKTLLFLIAALFTAWLIGSILLGFGKTHHESKVIKDECAETGLFVISDKGHVLPVYYCGDPEPKG